MFTRKHESGMKSSQIQDMRPYTFPEIFDFAGDSLTIKETGAVWEFSLHTDIQIHLVSPHIFSSRTLTHGLQNLVVMNKIEPLQVTVPLHYQSSSMWLYFLNLALYAILSKETMPSNRIHRVSTCKQFYIREWF